ncbi:MAG TPA: restriction endonuclease subunit S [Clostridia bacterium]|nr:restriction endonuclease subunit S [Clostridia bacterium]
MVTGWKEKKLGDIANVRMCKRIFAEQTTSTGEIPFYKIGTFGEKPDAYISRTLYDEYRSNYSFPSKGDILLSAAGTLGRTVVYDGKPAYFQDSNIVWLEIDKDQICNEYLNHCYQVIVWASPEGSTISRLYNGIIRNTEIILPPLPEQRRIAEVLSDMDALLAAMEKLIAKKHAIKQGSMQELLTGKRRLPGFEGEFVSMNLINNSTLKARIGWQGLTTSEYLDSGYSYLITGTDFDNGKIAWDTCHYVDKHRYDQDPNIQVVNGDVLITKDGTIGKVAIVSGLTKKATLNSGVFVLRPKNNAYDRKYIYYILLSHIFIDFLDKLSAGSTINHLYQKDFVSFEFDVPPTIAEQTAIAEILSDMDIEIYALTAKLNKLRNIKQGMMNELLTGRIRLIETEPAKATIEVCQKQEGQPIRFVKENNKPKGHNQQFDDAVMIAGIVNALCSEKFLLGRKRLQKCLYFLRRHQGESIDSFKKKAAGPYANEVRYRGGELIAKNCKYIISTTTEGKGTVFTPGANINQALQYIQNWEKEADIEWVVKNLKYKKTDELELLATVDMAVLELETNGTEVTVPTIKEYIASSAEWKDKLKRRVFNDAGIKYALNERKRLGFGG